MDTLQNLKTRIDNAKARFTGELRELQGLAATAFKLYMEAPERKQLVEQLEKQLNESRDLTQVQYDDYLHRWIRFDFTQLADIQDDEFLRELLGDYLREQYCIDADFKNDAASMSEGPALIIGDDGDVYDQDSQKTVIKRTEYDSRETLFALIESWMERGGYYPSVIRIDRHGNAYYVNTTKQASTPAA